MHVIIIGNGIAGVNAASALSAHDALTVEIFAAENHPLYSRVRLPEVLSGASTSDAIAFYKSEWYEQKKITVHTGKTVASVSPTGKEITLADGTRVSYDCLILATGASANRPGLPGANLPGVFTLRTMDDVASIRSHLAQYGDTASVIGGGLLGLEAARALKDAGAKKVRVFEIAPRLLPRQLDETGAALLQKRFEAMGIEVLCGVETEGFFADDARRAAGIVLKDGRKFQSDVTILSMGVHSNTELAKDAGLAVNRGIVVDNRMRTSDPSIYAVGDCAEFEGIVWGIIPAALEQAPVAAKAILASCKAIAGDQAPLYVQTVPKTALKVGEIEMMSLGKAVLTSEESSSGAYGIKSRVWDDFSRYEKFVFSPAPGGKGAILAGAILYGSKKHQGTVQKMMGLPVSAQEIDILLGDE